jgi:hypothetical protein
MEFCALRKTPEAISPNKEFLTQKDAGQLPLRGNLKGKRCPAGGWRLEGKAAERLTRINGR